MKKALTTNQMTNAYTVRRLEQRTSANADQAEFSAMLKGSATIDAGTFDDRIAEAMDDYAEESADRARWHKEDLKNDSASGGIREEVDRRADILESNYPFKIQGSQLTYASTKTGMYEFCLAVCSARTLTKGSGVRLPRTFERASARLVEAFMGDNALSLHTGAPRDAEVGVGFKEAMILLNEKSGEWFWGPEVDLPLEPSNEKDEGLDFVVWKAPPDKRMGRLFVVGQCACGDDWSDKFNDLNLNKLGKWFRPLAYVPPVRAFTTPHVLSDGHFTNAHREAGLVFDRLRLSAIAEQNEINSQLRSLRDQFAELVTMVIKQDVELSES